MVTTRPDLGKYRSGLVEDISILYWRGVINFVVGRWGWLGCHLEHGTYVAIFHTYQEMRI
jgi:hypothetical protein